MILYHSDHIHCIGIGGSGMNPIAHYLVDKGYTVTGSDIMNSPAITTLKNKGISIQIGHEKTSLVCQATAIVYSSAISPDNPELCYANTHKKNVFRRSLMLNQLFKSANSRIAVAGSHGKTTTAGMISHILLSANYNPSFIIGSSLTSKNSSYHCGHDSFFVIEADESDGSFLDFNASDLVILNLGKDHMSFFKTTENLHAHFKTLIQTTIDTKGSVYINADDLNLMTIIEDQVKENIFFYSVDTSIGVYATNINFSPKGISFLAHYNKTELGQINLAVFGHHNIYNALASIACLLKNDIPFSDIKAGLSSFQGTQRRMSYIGAVNDITIYDDYAHHPTEIKSTLAGIKKSFNQRIICIFQPHRYTRLHDFFSDFIQSFSDADSVVITDVFAAGESEILNISSKILTDKIQQIHPGKITYISQLTDIPSYLKPLLKPKDIVLTMGAGNIHTVAKNLLTQLKMS